ncbi:hypothetical protein D3C79_960970 [compost metagenome]
MIDIARARHDFQVREVPLGQFGQLQVGFHIVDGVNQYLGVRGTRRFQQIGTSCVAVKHFGTEFSQRFNVVRIVIQHHGVYTVGQQQTAGNLAETAEAGDDHAGVFFINHIRRALVLRRIFLQPCGHHQ